MKRRILLFCTAALALVLASVPLVSAAPQAPGTPTLRWVTTGATTAEIRADGITTGGTAGNGADLVGHLLQVSGDGVSSVSDCVDHSGAGLDRHVALHVYHQRQQRNCPADLTRPELQAF